jgi:hypothetical protein
VDVPSDLDAFLAEFITKRKSRELSSQRDLPLSRIWHSVNAVRPLGAAPFIDIINHCLAVDESFDFAAQPNEAASVTYLDAFMVNVVPMLDGVLKDEMRHVAGEVSEGIGLADAETARLERQMVSIGL